MHKKVSDELEQKITNLSLHADIDRGIFEEIYEKSGAKLCVEESLRLVGTHEDLSRYTRAQLEEKYHGILASYADLREQTLQFMTLFFALDLKVSHVLAIIEEEAAGAPLRHGELQQLLWTAGFSSTHKFYLVPDAPQKLTATSKPKRDRGKLRIIK